MSAKCFRKLWRTGQPDSKYAIDIDIAGVILITVFTAIVKEGLLLQRSLREAARYSLKSSYTI